MVQETGMLYFFYDFDDKPWDGEAAVFYYDGDLAELSPYIVVDAEGVTPDGKDLAWQQYTLEFAYNNSAKSKWGRAPKGLHSHFLLGPPTDPEQMGLGKGPPEDWQMILQMSSFIGDGTYAWGGDLGYLCYFVSKDDFARKDFSKAWFRLAVS